ncbi:MAG: hypothetical protein EOO20_21565 [Chryseobacterium sp.]|nr:MAG: hypothetical protein EOO20_21565 [Chryseobacterium sp.]
MIKIGKSINQAYRERTLHSQEPAVHLIAIWCCAKQIERELHKMFYPRRSRGEWFRLTISNMTTLEKFMNTRLSLQS